MEHLNSIFKNDKKLMNELDTLKKENTKLRRFLKMDGFIKVLRDRDDLKEIITTMQKDLEELSLDTTSPVVKLHTKILKITEKANNLTA